jgi:uncharacterized Zn-binding protein involved in type VI secretion
MPECHRQDDARACGATTIVSGQNFVTVDGKLWAVNGDENTDGDGQLISSQTWVTIAGKGVIVRGDNAQPDDLCPSAGGDHCDPVATGFDPLITVG